MIPQNPPVINEAGISNIRGTLGAARGVDPNSATSQWYINVRDNLPLDTQFGGQTVFGYVSSGMDVVD